MSTNTSSYTICSAPNVYIFVYILTETRIAPLTIFKLTLTGGRWLVFQTGKVLVSPPSSSGHDITSENEQYKLRLGRIGTRGGLGTPYF